MKRSSLLLVIGLAFAAIIVFFVLYELHLVMIEVRGDIHNIAQSAGQTVTAANGVMRKAQTVEDRLIIASDQETKAWKNIDRELAKTIGDVHDVTIHTDCELNGCPGHGRIGPVMGMLPSGERLIISSNDAIRAIGAIAPVADVAIKEVSSNAVRLVNDVEPSIQNSNQATAAWARAMSDPEIHQTFVNIAGMTADGHAETSLFVAKTKDAFKPQNKFLALAKMLGGGTLSAAEFYYYMTH